MKNPFRLRWLQGWTFQLVLMEGHVQVEASGFGIRLRSAVLPGESPQSAADRLVLSEDRRRRALHHAWLRGQELNQQAELPITTSQASSNETLVSLVVVEQDSSKLAA
ncbi:MAG: copper-binding protein [Cyanobacteriota bacterium]|nr:copper-binding protein [Cyanobacteriota bacterium]